MSNLGLELALRERGIALVRVQVGDRYVVEEMVRGGYQLGGEQSGHIVFLEHGTTGDGLVTALGVLALMVESGKPLSELRRRHDAPAAAPGQRARARAPRPGGAARRAAASSTASARDLGGRGRVLVRYSGTEPLVRVMVEGEHVGAGRALLRGDRGGAARARRASASERRGASRRAHRDRA